MCAPESRSTSARSAGAELLSPSASPGEQSRARSGELKRRGACLLASTAGAGNTTPSISADTATSRVSRTSSAVEFAFLSRSAPAATFSRRTRCSTTLCNFEFASESRDVSSAATASWALRMPRASIAAVRSAFLSRSTRRKLRAFSVRSESACASEFPSCKASRLNSSAFNSVVARCSLATSSASRLRFNSCSSSSESFKLRSAAA
mmetsp:Transcript_19266/g.49021  ORF Transcript_19266/g.49021 Transcript_19266/m.49021 type:complete len:207 (+) Transcript_19266:636-1256(+)